MTRFTTCLIACLWAATALTSPAFARDPLKRTEEGATALDQRILTRPGALLHKAPGGDAIDRPSVFTSFYVFDRKSEADAEWLEVGAARRGDKTAWVLAAQTFEWKQTITLGFEGRAGRLPVMFFEDKEPLKTFMTAPDLSNRAEILAAKIELGEGAGDSGVIALEPATQVSLTDQFYLLPILDFDKVSLNRRSQKLLEVASVNLNAESQPAPEVKPFKTGIVFVVDTSISMQPYIDTTREALRRILSDLKASGQGDHFSLGLIGFRGDSREVPGLEYTAQQFHPLQADFDEAAFLAAIEGMKAATVSSKHNSEDGLAGMLAASQIETWSQFDGRYVIYVSDAGMLVGEAQGSQVQSTPALLAERLRKDQNIATFGLFLEAPSGQRHHEEARAQLTQLTWQEAAGRPLLFPIANADVSAFEGAVSGLVSALLEQVTIATAAAASGANPCAASPEDLRCAADQIGHAMRLAWLGRQEQTQAPATYTSWVSDVAFDDTTRRTLSPRVLLTRAQLNDLYVTLKSILEAAQSAEQVEPEKFFSVLRTTLSHTMRDPGLGAGIDSSGAARLASLQDFDDLGDLVADYLRNLPYESDLASETLESWVARDPAGRYEFIQSLRSKLQIYELYHADIANWISLNPEAGDEEKVYPLPLEFMP